MALVIDSKYLGGGGGVGGGQDLMGGGQADEYKIWIEYSLACIGHAVY
jgi:hypothetical protein